MKTNRQPLSEIYRDRLQQDFGPSVASDFDHVKTAAVPELPGQSLDYLRVRAVTEIATSDTMKQPRPVLFVNGYMAGIVANAPFAGAMAREGFEVILPDQSRTGISNGARGRKDASVTQAYGLMAVLEAEGLANQPMDVVTHSYGSLVFDALHTIARKRTWECFEGSTVALMAPAGIKRDERTLSFMRRYIALMRAGRDMQQFPDSYWEFAEEMMAAGQANFKANPKRALREGYEIMSRHVHIEEWLKDGIERVALVMFGEDKLFSAAALQKTLPQVLGERVVAFSPVSLEDNGGKLRSGTGADHNDQQFNPARVAASVGQFLRSV